MKPIISFLLLWVIFGSCGNTQITNTKKELTSENQVQKEKLETKTCTCFNGIGSAEGETPILSHSFSNDETIIICGYQEHELISEFDLFNCKNGNSIARYGAVQLCHITSKKDTIEIIELKNLPAANWEMRLMPIGRELIVIADDAIASLGQQAHFKNPEISLEQQNEFLDDLDLNKNNGLQHDWDWEEILAKLEVLSLMKNKRAKKFLFNIQEITKYQFDGALSEQYKEALANVNWME